MPLKLKFLFIGGTFGQVQECVDNKRKEFVVIKVVRSIQKYREASMIEIDVLQKLSRHDVTGGKKATAFPVMCNKLSDPSEAESRVVVDGNLVTSRGPGTTMEFSLVIAEKFSGEKALELAKTILFRTSVEIKVGEDIVILLYFISNNFIFTGEQKVDDALSWNIDV